MKVLTVENFRRRTTKAQRDQIQAWVEKNGYRFNLVYMVDQTDDPNYLTIHSYAVNEKGVRYIKPGADEAAIEQAVLVPSAGFPMEIWDKL